MSQPLEVTSGMSSTQKSEISDILSSFLKECDISLPGNIQLDNGYRDACYADAARRGIDLSLVSKHLDVGIAIGDTAYRHLENYSTRVFIAVWVGLVTHVDDCCEAYEAGLKEFSNRFMRQEPQLYPALDRLSEVTRELTEHWDTIGADAILAAQLDFMTSSLIEISIKDMEIQSLAPGFPKFTRRMSGTARAYAVLAFPRELDVKEWIQVSPDLMHYIEHVNDIFSFYKEELSGEDVNFVSLSAQAKGVTKIEALEQLANTTVKRYRRASQLLQSYPKARDVFKAFCEGYVVFHAISPRYKLDQLSL